jgi:hypothetical protein
MTSQPFDDGYVGFKPSLLHHPLLQKIRTYPWLLGGAYSYLYVETDINGEHETISALRVQAGEQTKHAVLGPVLSRGQNKRFPATLQEAIAALAVKFPPRAADDERLGELRRNFANLINKKPKKKNELQIRLELEERILEWRRILGRLSKPVRELMGAWIREERDQIHHEISRLTCLSWSARKFHGSHVRAFRLQEDRWKYGVSMGKVETCFYYFWILLIALNTFYLDLISVYLLSVLATIRCGPLALLCSLVHFNNVDYQFSDERLLRSYLLVSGLGSVLAGFFGALKLIWPDYFKDAFSTKSALAWRAVLCCAWQMTMHNWKNFFDFGCSLVIRQNKIEEPEIAEVARLYGILRLTNAYLFAWLDTLEPNTRCGYQLSCYKRDHEDAANALKWAARIKERMPNKDFWSKLFVLFEVSLLGGVVVASTILLDTYAALLLISSSVPYALRTLYDVWKHSQSFQDLQRLFTLTIGPTTPTTIAMLINVIYWGATGKQLFESYESLAFKWGFAILVVATLYNKLWCEGFTQCYRQFQKSS